MVEVLSPFPYKMDKIVPWNYNCSYLNKTVAKDLTGVEGITRSGRCYSPTMTENVVQGKMTKSAEEKLFKANEVEVVPKAQGASN